MLFDYFKDKKDDHVQVPKVQKLKLTNINKADYYAQKLSGGPMLFKTDAYERTGSIKVIMNAIKVWKNKKTFWKE